VFQLLFQIFDPFLAYLQPGEGNQAMFWELVRLGGELAIGLNRDEKRV